MKRRFAVVPLVAHLLIGALTTICEAAPPKTEVSFTSKPVAKDGQNESDAFAKQSRENQSSLNRIQSFSASSFPSSSAASPQHFQSKASFERMDSISSALSSTETPTVDKPMNALPIKKRIAKSWTKESTE
ncbi:hypothetical protein niasHT_004452 [Heterodera trifolii]|uniref:Uncharacterized protein n=1 Tax=Heterodera trifolii TaxID=157864 RepID=A0ABD2LQK8_9BILA